MSGDPLEVKVEGPQFCALPDGQCGNEAVCVCHNDSSAAAGIGDSGGLHVVGFPSKQDGKGAQRMMQPAELGIRSDAGKNLLQDNAGYAKGSVLLDQPAELPGQGHRRPAPTEHKAKHRAIEDDHRFLRAAL
jgi:hypothetical protein